jgi:membrane protein
MSFITFAKRLYREYENDGVADGAAALSYYFVFSLFPFLFFLTTLTAYLPFVSQSVDKFMERAHALLPAAASDIIEEHLRALIDQPRPQLVTIGLLVTLYTASRGVDAVRKALNLAYDVKESRPLWKTELLAFGMTAGGAILVLLAITFLVSGGDLGFWLARKAGIATEYVFVWRWLRWPVAALVMTFCAALVYFVLPDVKQKFRFIRPGSVVGTVVWLVASWGFSMYAANFGKYNITYGSIGGVVVLMTWFYISGFIFLMGGELNAILEDAAPEGKRSGARAPEQAPPPADERPSAMPPGAAAKATAAERTRGGAGPLVDAPAGGTH